MNLSRNFDSDFKRSKILKFYVIILKPHKRATYRFMGSTAVMTFKFMVYIQI